MNFDFEITAQTVSTAAAEIIRFAIINKASDIHLNPEKGGVRLSFRIQGAIIDTITIPFDLYRVIVHTLRSQAGVNKISKAPQDGRIEVDLGDGRQTSMRFAAVHCQMFNCDKITIRLTDKDVNLLHLEALNFEDDVLDEMRLSLTRNFGLFLVTGPTGSGKTTTLYAALNYIKTQTRLNILTIEDPVEFPINGVIQIETHANASFNETLESFLRHDPDVIMVGEIRSSDTANLAVRSALTGHLVVSTLHANTALLSVTRLLNLGVDPFNLSFILAGIENQRLAKILCSNCRTSRVPLPHEVKMFPSDPPALVYNARPEGCARCTHGISTRRIMYEYISFTPERQDALFKRLQHQESLEESFVAYLRSEGPYRTLSEHALEFLRHGYISPDEFLRFR